jgi:RNA-directed DNA polymerase
VNASKLANYTNVKARELWKTLYLCAKENSKRRFHTLYDKIYRPDILAEAWRRVKRNKGSGGVDGTTIANIVEEYGESRFLNEIYLDLKKKTPFSCSTRLYPERKRKAKTTWDSHDQRSGGTNGNEVGH